MGRETLQHCLRWVAPLIVLAAGLLVATKSISAKPDYTRRTRMECEFCHPPNSRDLNEAGRYYQEHKNSLAGYKPKPAKSKTNDKSAKAGPGTTAPPTR
jgi:hypothetical protein